MKTEKLVAVLLLIGIALFLSGCSNLKVQWVANLTYQSDSVLEDIKRAREADEERAKPVERERIVYSIAK